MLPCCQLARLYARNETGPRSLGTVKLYPSPTTRVCGKIRCWSHWSMTTWGQRARGSGYNPTADQSGANESEDDDASYH